MLMFELNQRQEYDMSYLESINESLRDIARSQKLSDLKRAEEQLRQEQAQQQQLEDDNE